MKLNQTTASQPFSLNAIPADHWTSPILRVGKSVAERLLSLSALNEIYEATQRECRAKSFCERALAILQVGWNVDASALARIPSSGPLVVVANHPFGGLEGIVLTAILQRVRPDVRVLANHLLARIPDMHETCIFVNPFGGSGATEANRGSMKVAIRWVKGGGVLGVFPAGTVSHLSLRDRCVSDPEWSETVGRIVQLTGAPVLPVFFEGQNGAAFQIAGLIHPRLRTLLLPRQMANKLGTTVTTRIGSVISPSRLEVFDESRELIDYLRLRTYLLKTRKESEPNSTRTRSQPKTELAAPIAPPISDKLIRDEINALPAERTLVTSGSLKVICCRASEIPLTLSEIGRLRELTFRKVGEGTGKERDLDRFDEYYHHLFVWNHDQSRVIGAYRVGATDEILPRFGVDGLYTNSLFRYKSALLNQINPALELGRSFIVDDYQKSYSALLLLWKGIGRYACMNPRYRYLFGTVSISDDYNTMTKQLLMAFLSMGHYQSELGSFVRPKNPPKIKRLPPSDEKRLTSVVRSLDDADDLVSEIESNGKHMPVLLRQYLRLNAKVLGFNIDPDFGDVLDGLVVVDLVNVDDAVLSKYMGKEEARIFKTTYTQSANSM